MSAAGLVRYYWLTYLSQPAADRRVYTELARRPARSILEVGVGTALRTERLLDLCLEQLPREETLRYVAIDLFDARPAGAPRLSLKQAHKTIKRDRVQVLLAPGDPLSALSRVANSVKNVDCVIVSADQDRQSLQAAWRYLPRMTHAGTVVFLERPTGKGTEFVQTTVADAFRPAVRERLARAA